MSYILKLAYKGTAYCGWQVQPGLSTVQGVLQDACERVFGYRPDVTGCSRTDSGVHAKGFIARVDADGVPVDSLPRALGSVLPGDISVLEASCAYEGFHPRYDAIGKEYIYTVRNSAVRDPFTDDFCLLYRRHIDEKTADATAKEFIGRQDFAAFMATGSKITDTVRTVTEFDVTRDGDYVYFRVCADGFLYNMVRIMVGTVIGIAAEGREVSVSEIIASRDRANAGATMPAKGLCLNRVFYGKEF